jgi:hypothetical protein
MRRIYNQSFGNGIRGAENQKAQKESNVGRNNHGSLMMQPTADDPWATGGAVGAELTSSSLAMGAGKGGEGEDRAYVW